MSRSATSTQKRATRICMHVLTTARLDPRVLREAESLVGAGYNVTVVDLEREAGRPQIEMLRGVRLRHIVLPGRFKRSRFGPTMLLKVANMLIGGALAVFMTPADIYHAHDDNALYACYLTAVLRRKKLVLDAHELPLVEPHHTRWKRLSALARWSLRRMTPRCDGIITVSPQIVDDFHRRYGGRRAVLVRNIPPYASPVTSDRLRQELGIGPDDRIALYQGGIQENRRLDILVRAAHYVAGNVRIIIMGNGESTDKIKGMIVEENVADRVVVIPAAPYQELLSWTASADVGLILYDPNFSENVRLCLPNKLFEYVMAGLPILASPLVAVADVLRDYDMGVVTRSLSPESVGPAINALLADDAGRARMRRNALLAARQTFNWEVEQYHLLNLYADILGTPRTAPEGGLAPTLPRMASANQPPQRQSSMR